MWWRANSAAYDQKIMWCWHSLPAWHQAEIIAVHEMKQELLSIKD